VPCRCDDHNLRRRGKREEREKEEKERGVVEKVRSATLQERGRDVGWSESFNH
jgi:hypothetical protein